MFTRFLPLSPTKESTGDKDLSLSLLAEVLAARALPGSLELITCLLETLGAVAHASPASDADHAYVEQLLMSAVEASASAIAVSTSLLATIARSHFSTQVTQLKPGSIRLDILVELIRCMSFLLLLVLLSSDFIFDSRGKPSNIPPGVAADRQFVSVGSGVCASQHHACVHVHGLERLPPGRYLQFPSCTEGK